MFVRLFVCLFVRLFVCLFVRLFVCLFGYDCALVCNSYTQARMEKQLEQHSNARETLNDSVWGLKEAMKDVKGGLYLYHSHSCVTLYLILIPIILIPILLVMHSQSF